MDNNRRSPRQRTFKGGVLSLPTGSVQCTIRNMSSTGALIEFSGPVAAPDTFTLIIKPELLKRSCKVVWRSAKQVGVRFV